MVFPAFLMGQLFLWSCLTEKKEEEEEEEKEEEEEEEEQKQLRSKKITKE